MAIFSKKLQNWTEAGQFTLRAPSVIKLELHHFALRNSKITYFSRKYFDAWFKPLPKQNLIDCTPDVRCRLKQNNQIRVNSHTFLWKIFSRSFFRSSIGLIIRRPSLHFDAGSKPASKAQFYKILCCMQESSANTAFSPNLS